MSGICGALAEVKDLATGTVLARLTCDRFAGHLDYGEPHGAQLTWDEPVSSWPEAGDPDETFDVEVPLE